LSHIAEAAKVEVLDLIHDLLDATLADGISNLAIIQYKKGSMKAIDAWKISGLSYQEFQTQALLSSLPENK
jgi:hypothetical protein